MAISNPSRRPNERGSILVLSTVGVVIAMIAAALAVDLGFLAQEARTAQKVADLAALDAARVVPAEYNAAAQASASRNNFPTSGVTAVEGVKVDGECQPQAGAGTVCVTATSPHKNAFPFVGGPSTLSRTAVAGAPNAIGTVRVGSKVASADGSIPTTQDALLDKTIGALIGSPSYQLSAVGWEGLVSGKVTFGALTSALATATGKAVFNVGTPDQILNTTFTAAELFTATASALHNSGNAADLAIENSVQNIRASANGTFLDVPLKLYDLFNFGGVVVGNKQDVANATLNVLDLIRGGAILADSDHLAAFNLAAADVVGGAIPGGFSSVKVTMGLIEAPRTATGAAGKDTAGAYYTHAETSQIRVRLDVTIKVPLVSGITQNVLGVTVSLVPAGTLVDATFSYYLQAGEAHAYLDAVHCGASAEPTSVDIVAKTDVGTTKFGFVTETALGNRAAATVPMVAPAAAPPVVDIAGILKVRMASGVTTNIPGNPVPPNPMPLLTFTPPYSATSASQPISGTMLSLPSLATTNLTVDPLLLSLDTGTLLSDLVQGINSTGITFSSGTPGLTTSIIKPLYDALGLSFGGADVWAPPPQNCAALSQLSTSGTVGGTPVLRG